MKTQINSPKVSKINWTALVIALVGVASSLGYISEDIKEQLTEAVMIGGPALIVVWRTWFTEPGGAA